jgi:hypothetical protein
VYVPWTKIALGITLIGDLLISARNNLILERPAGRETVASSVMTQPFRYADIIHTVLATLVAVIVTLGVLEVCARLLVISAVPRQAHNPEFDAKFVIAKTQIPVSAGRPAIFIGGSYVRTGIYAELLQSLLQERGITIFPKNLGTSASSIIEHMTLLTTAVDSCKRTPVVFYDLRQLSFSKAFQQNSELNSRSDFLNSYMGRKYAVANPNLLQRLQLLLEDNFCLIRQRGFLRAKLINLMPVLFGFDKEYENAMVRRDNSSILPVSTMGTILVPVFSNVQFDRFFQEFTDDDHGDLVHWSGMDWSDAWLNIVKTYCRQKNMPLVLLWMPEYLPQDKESDQTRQRCRELAAHYAALADNQHVWLIDMHDIDKQRNHFRDPFHCNTVGAINATEELAKRLTQPQIRHIMEDEGNK